MRWLGAFTGLVVLALALWMALQPHVPMTIVVAVSMASALILMLARHAP